MKLKELKLDINCDKYKFDETRHKHYINGNEVTGTTTICGVIDKPALMPWAVKVSMEKLVEITGDGPLTKENIDEAKKAPFQKKTTAGSFGTVVHAVAEHFNKTGVVLPCNSLELDEKVQSLAQTFTEKELKKGDKLISQYIEWFNKVGAKVLYVEQNVFSETHHIGGIFDLVLEINGKIYLTDFKTSSGVYPSQFIQMGGYDIQLEEMMERGYIQDFAVDGFIVIHLPRKGSCKVHIKENTDHYRRAFRACIYIYRLINDQLWAL
jgi:hypothetical protein